MSRNEIIFATAESPSSSITTHRLSLFVLCVIAIQTLVRTILTYLGNNVSETLSLASHSNLASNYQLSAVLLSFDSRFVVSLISISVVVAAFINLVLVQDGRREPPEIYARVPLVGHIAGFWKHGITYFKRLADAFPALPIYTLRLANQRVYVVNTPEFSKIIERNTKTLSFMPLEIAVSERILRIGKEDMAKIHNAMSFDHGQSGYMRELHNIHHEMLNLGSVVNSMRDNGFKEIASSLNCTQEADVDLYSWTRHILTTTCTTAVWGRGNPFREDQELEDAFWAVEDQLKPLLINILPEYLAPSGFQARERVYEKLLAYYESEGFNEPSASGLVRAKAALNQQHGFSNEYMARTDLGELTAVLFNLVPASFWLLLYICSSPSLLGEIRAEIHDTATTQIGNEGAADHLKPSLLCQCRLLLATYHEVLRIVGSGVTTNRVVLEDTLVTLAQKDYVLKKGGIVQIPANVIHSDPSIWGADALEFNPRRFIDRPKLASSSAFRTFGGGASRCPGRRFAQTQALAFVAGVVMGWDLDPLNDNTATWMLPEMDMTRLPGLFKPLKDVRVRIKRRTR